MKIFTTTKMRTKLRCELLREKVGANFCTQLNDQKCKYYFPSK